MLRPIGKETHIRWLERRDGNAGTVEYGGPAAIRSKPRPACAAEREDRRVGGNGRHAVRRGERQASAFVPAAPRMPECEPDPRGIEPAQPRAQQWGGLHRLRKYAAARSDKSRRSERTSPGAQSERRDRRDRARQLLGGLPISRQKRRHVLAVRDIEPAASRHQK